MSAETSWGSETGQAPVAVQLDTLRKKVVLLEAENRRFMASQGQLVAESNRKTELHCNEMGLLKEELRNLRRGNKELRDLCCFLDDDRHKSRKLAKEWQKFANYTSHLMKQEVHAYQGRLREIEDRHQMMVMENDQLKRLCLYLDEQRQAIINNSGCYDEHDNSGCESSGRGSDAPDETEGDAEREKAIRLITKEMQTSISFESHPSTRPNESHDNGDRIISYIQSLENRIKQLEQGNNCHQGSPFWPSQSSDLNNATVIEKGAGSYWCSASSDDVSETLESASVTGSISSDGRSKDVISPPTSKMAESTSSGTTYCSSLTDESAVLVMGDGFDPPISENLEVRTLPPIDEEEDSTTTERTIPDLPPPIAPISESVGRLSSCSSDVTCSTMSSDCCSRFSDDVHRPPAPAYSAPRDSLAEAVEVLRVHEMAARRNKRGLSTKQTAMLQQMCQVAWDSLDRKSKAQMHQQQRGSSKSPPPQISSAV